MFHPTFLYEAALVSSRSPAVLVWLGPSRGRSARGRSSARSSIAGYPLGRFFIELMRTDEANRILGLRVNTWVSAARSWRSAVFLYTPRRSRRTAPRTLRLSRQAPPCRTSDARRQRLGIRNDAYHTVGRCFRVRYPAHAGHRRPAVISTSAPHR
ncbi:MAG: prolipoprotein diacylglyceryl transferase family protein [Dermatophilaceae bacterium]